MYQCLKGAWSGFLPTLLFLQFLSMIWRRFNSYVSFLNLSFLSFFLLFLSCFFLYILLSMSIWSLYVHVGDMGDLLRFLFLWISLRWCVMMILQSFMLVCFFFLFFLFLCPLFSFNFILFVLPGPLGHQLKRIIKKKKKKKNRSSRAILGGYPWVLKCYPRRVLIGPQGLL
jgi:hypothetical protein